MKKCLNCEKQQNHEDEYKKKCQKCGFKFDGNNNDLKEFLKTKIKAYNREYIIHIFLIFLLLNWGMYVKSYYLLSLIIAPVCYALYNFYRIGKTRKRMDKL